MSIVKVRLCCDAYMVCLHHALTTECEEIMGLLIGQYSKEEEEEEDDLFICDIFSAITLRRSDKRKDRVEISPEMLIQAQQKAELMSASTNQDLNIVGWYHSHPHITVLPSEIDLQTQAGYQQLDSRFIGLIFSVYSEDQTTKVGRHQLTCFQAARSPADPSRYERIPIPFHVITTPSLSPNNQQALETLLETLFEEQKEILEESRKNHSKMPLVHLENSAVMVRNVLGLSRLISGPLVACLEKEIQLKTASVERLQDEAEYLKQLLKINGVDAPS